MTPKNVQMPNPNPKYKPPGTPAGGGGGTLMENSMLKVGGQHFRCICGANVFHKGVKPGLWICNGCGAEYTDETYDHRKTNADLIRAMSDEELAKFLEDWDFCYSYCPQGIAHSPWDPDCSQGCTEELLSWLQQPAEEET